MIFLEASPSSNFTRFFLVYVLLNFSFVNYAFSHTDPEIPIAEDSEIFIGKNHTEADQTFSWYKKSAEHGNAPVQYNLGDVYFRRIYLNGELTGELTGIERNLELAFYWMKKSAEQGYAPAQYGLAMMYYYGEGTAQNFELAFDWWKKSAEQGYAPAQYSLANMYYYGEGIEKDLERAFHWMKKSAEQGYAPAQQFLEEIYEQLSQN